ncbi:baseplate J/gp47 family protein [Serratia entomophila]|uniref:hypothetical protein n=1 Tax=Serratia entomophila TaxID=42906 RepID=UPI00217CC0B5|nr:hypothetical protein [Serratia entomophila]CAI1561069.1 Uncharacterized homolog of phage Mu protein gp47 [Serratia entomophila]
MIEETKKATGMAATNKDAATFVLDDRSIGRQLEAFRLYCQHLPLDQHHDDITGPGRINWAQVMLGYKAGAVIDASADTLLRQESERDWSSVREQLVQLYETPAQADGQLPPERAFLLAMLGMLETPRALLNQLPAQHRSLYYQRMLALTPQTAQADQVTVHFTLDKGVREQVLPAGLLLDAGQDNAGTALRYALAQPLAVNGARITDLRWVVSDPCVPGGRRARVVMDEAAGLPWPQGGVRLFGASPAKAGEASGPDTDRAVDSGRIIESPVLAVAGGVRTWTVTLANALKGELQASVSMGDAWAALTCSRGADNTWTVTLPAEGGRPAAVTTLEGLVSTAPLLRLTSKTGVPVPKVTSLAVKVEGAVGVHCASDDGTVLSEGGLPFGERADVGLGVNLMVPDWWQLGATLQQVTVTPTWVGLPDTSFPQWYGPDSSQKDRDWLYVDDNLNVTTPTLGWTPSKLVARSKTTLAGRVTNGTEINVLVDGGYEGKPLNDQDFTVQASLVLKGMSPLPLDDTPTPMFENNEAKDCAPQGRPLSIQLDGLPSLLLDTAVRGDEDDPTRWPWYLRLQLNTSFLQNKYLAHQNAPLTTVMFLTEKKITQLVPVTEKSGDYTIYKMVPHGNTNMPAMQETSTTVVTPVPVLLPKAQWNPPYVPKWSGVQVDYTAVDTLVSQRVILPFGFAPEDSELTQSSAEAELYLGLDGIEEAQLLTLHWQLKSPGALPVPLEWQYLTPGERWARLPVNDGTNGWQTSGVMSVDWPGDASRVTTSLPAGRLWLRGRARQLTPRDNQQVMLPTTPWLTGLVTNAASASLVAPTQVQATHFETGLPAGRITQALDAPESLQAVTQPWPSEGGRAAETRAIFEARVARRLRHRERGLNNLDLMMLLQERHAGIREMAVLPILDALDGVQKQRMVVMPGQTLSDSDDRRRPGLSPAHLHDMVEWLKTCTSPWLTLECVNPEYVPVSVSWQIDYVPGLSHAVGNARVKAALEAALMPWAREEDDRRQSVMGRAVTHSAVREVLRRVPEVATVKKIYINGDEEKSPLVAPSQVMVLTCIPLEYTGLTIAWVDALAKTPTKVIHAYGECTLSGDGKQKATVRVTVPNPVRGVGAAPITEPKADVYLVDLATGQRLPGTTASGTAVWAETVGTISSESGSSYADQYYTGMGSNQGSEEHFFYVSAVAGTCGVYHLGVVVALSVNGIPDVTLQSAAIGECVVLRVQAPEEK